MAAAVSASALMAHGAGIASAGRSTRIMAGALWLTDVQQLLNDCHRSRRVSVRDRQDLGRDIELRQLLVDGLQQPPFAAGGARQLVGRQLFAQFGNAFVSASLGSRRASSRYNSRYFGSMAGSSVESRPKNSDVSN